jgi:hypothetical protein
MRKIKLLNKYEEEVIKRLRNKIEEVKENNPKIKCFRLTDISIIVTFEEVKKNFIEDDESFSLYDGKRESRIRKAEGFPS